MGAGALPPELLYLAPLAMAAGVDLYLTLLVLGAASASGIWQTLPGTLDDLGSPWILILVGAFYVAEVLAETKSTSALVWNAFHATIRPLAGALLALLLLDGQSPLVVIPAAVVAGGLASAVHTVHSGTGVLFWLDATPPVRRLLVAALEDVCVLGILVLMLDDPAWALGVTLFLSGPAFPSWRSQVRAFPFAVRLVWARAWRPLRQPKWTDAAGLPRWVHAEFEGDILAGVRGSRAGAYRLPGAPRFIRGWIVVRGDSPLFLYRRRRVTHAVPMERLGACDVTEEGFFRRVDFTDPERAHLYFGYDGPGLEALKAEFLAA